MAANDGTTIAPGITREDSAWGYSLEGNKADLLSCGLVQASWFPNGRVDKRGRTIRNLCSEYDGRSVRCTEPAKGLCRVTIDYSFEERERMKQRKRIAEAAAEAKRKLAQLPGDGGSFLQDRALWAEVFIRSFASISGDPKYDGYRLHPDTISEIQRIGGHLVAAIEEGQVLFDRAARASAETKIRAEFAEHDPAFAQFVGLAINGAVGEK